MNYHDFFVSMASKASIDKTITEAKLRSSQRATELPGGLIHPGAFGFATY
jgi:hypothetical protein